MVPEKAGGEIALSMLEVLVEHPEVETGITNSVFPDFTMATDMGVNLADGRREITLFLPTLETTFKLRSKFHNLLNQAGMLMPAEPLRVQKFTPVSGTNNRLEISVPPPQRKAP